MDTDKKNALIEKGVSYDEALHRFLGMEEMYERFLLQYASDESMGNIIQGLNDNDIVAVFKAAHGMKGLAGNLGITSVYELANSVTEMTRGKESMDEVDRDLLADSIEELRKADSDISAIICEE